MEASIGAGINSGIEDGKGVQMKPGMIAGTKAGMKPGLVSDMNSYTEAADLSLKWEV